MLYLNPISIGTLYIKFKIINFFCHFKNIKKKEMAKF